MLVARNGGKAPLTMASFTKLVDKVGCPPAPVPDPPAVLPRMAVDALGTDPKDTYVPTWQEVGFTQPPVTIFKVRAFV